MKQPDWKMISIEERLEHLEPHRANGASATELARLFVNCSRNSIIGLLTRKKLPLMGVFVGGRRAGSETGAIKKAAKAPAFGQTAMGFVDRSSTLVEVPIKTIIDKPKGRLLALVELRDDTCKWPIGDPRDLGFGFCGQHSPEGSPYCPTHKLRSVHSN